jgi:hypothetical protein
MTVLFFMLLSSLMLYFVFLLIRERNDLIFTRYRFRYFALRDEMAMLVMRGRIQEESWEYQRIVAAINFHISAVETVSMIRVVSILIAYHTSQEGRREFSVLARRIENPDVADIMVRYMDTTFDLLMRNSRWQIRFIDAAKWLLDLVGSAARPPRDLVDNPREALNNIKHDKSALQGAWSYRSATAVHS